MHLPGGRALRLEVVLPELLELVPILPVMGSTPMRASDAASCVAMVALRGMVATAAAAGGVSRALR